MVLAGLFGATAFLGFGCTPESSPNESRSHGPTNPTTAQAAEWAAAGQLVRAARALRTIAPTLPDERRVEAHSRAGEYYASARLPRAALEEADQALSLRGDHVPSLFVRGRALLELERHSEAAETLEKLLRAEPEHDDAAIEFARVLLELGRNEEALRWTRGYFAREGASPPTGAALLAHGRALRAAGELQPAVDRLIEAIERSPFESRAYAELSGTYYRLRKRRLGQLAERVYSALEQAAFEDHVAVELAKIGAAAAGLSQRAMNLVKAKRFVEAHRTFGFALQALEAPSSGDGISAGGARPIDARVPFHFAEFLLSIGRSREAGEIVEGTLSRPTFPTSGLLWLRARIELDLERWDASRANARAALEAANAEGELGGYVKAQAPRLAAALVWTRAALENAPDEAEAALAAARESEPERWEVSYWSGRIALARGDPTRARTEFGLAAARGATDFADLYYWNAVALREQGFNSEASAQLRQIQARERIYSRALEARIEILDSDPGSGESSAALRAELDRAVAQDEMRQALELGVDEGAFATRAPAYLALARFLGRIGDPAASDRALLAAQLDSSGVDAIRLVLPRLTRPEDRFYRLALTRKWHERAPDDVAAAGALLALYLELETRADEARRLADVLLASGEAPYCFLLAASEAGRRGDLDAARRILREGMTRHPGADEIVRALRDLDSRSEPPSE